MESTRESRELIDATRPFAEEDIARSTFATLSSFAVLAASIAIAAAPLPLAVRGIGTVLAGLSMVRAFCLYHDHLHGSILRRSAWAKALYWVYGCLVLTPPSVWRATHNYHHAHTAKIVGSHVGSYMVLTVDMYERATPTQRRMYRAIRHPLTIACGYLTIFAYGMCVAPFLRNPRKHRDAPFALGLHVAISIAIAWVAGPLTMLLAYTLPLAIACALGGYLFYAQHNFPGMHLAPRESWTFAGAALESSSFMRMGPVLSWFTANIGYHHVHHLNPGIPFYRLPEAMAAIPELKHPHETTLSPRSILECFRLKLWDPQRGEMVGYPKGS